MRKRKKDHAKLAKLAEKKKSENEIATHFGELLLKDAIQRVANRLEE